MQIFLAFGHDPCVPVLAYSTRTKLWIMLRKGETCDEQKPVLSVPTRTISQKEAFLSQRIPSFY